MNLSEDQVIALSPDDASTKSGKDLAKQDKWLTTCISNLALWGECKGSGSKPYQTQIDTQNIAFKCSCPSRKFPCKHGLGLLLLYTKNSGSFKSDEQPAWVTDWITKRAQKEEKKTEPKDEIVDVAAQKKRLQSRQSKVNDGIEELLLWIKDIIRNGLLQMPEKSTSYWTNMAKRMVDAQAPGLARFVNILGNTNFFNENWQQQFLNTILELYLIAKAYKHVDSHTFLQQEELKSLIGFTQNQEELKEQPGIVDHWIALSKQTSEDGNLTTEKYWLYGAQNNRYALLLQFIVNGQGKVLTLSPGMIVQAELVFYPSVIPMRAIIKRQVASNHQLKFSGFANWNAVNIVETTNNSLFPINMDRPYIVEKIKLVFFDNTWWLQDEENCVVRIRKEFYALYTMLAISAGDSCTVVVLGKGNLFEPLGIFINEKYYLLS